MRNGELQETFIEAPNSRTDVKIKLSLPVLDNLYAKNS
jgi:hypothetical protein